MPITTGHGSKEKDRRLHRTTDKKSDLVCRVKYQNTLPDIPCDPKFIKYPFENNRFIEYNPTSLERNFKFELLTEHDLDIGKNLDFLILPELYAPNPDAQMNEKDGLLVEDEVATPQDSKRSRQHNKNVSWLRKTEYISTEYNRFVQSSEKSETKVGFNIKKYFSDDNMYKDRQSQIDAIEQTFEDSKLPIDKHYAKPGVYPKDILPVLPDFQLWKFPCAQVIFDSDPARKTKTPQRQWDEMSNAQIRGMSDESGESFVAYFMPTEETLSKRTKYSAASSGEGSSSASSVVPPEERFEYELVREYNWNVKNKASKGYEEDYFFAIRSDGVYYNELETRVRLSKRKRKSIHGKSFLVVAPRDFTEQEYVAQQHRMSQLEPPQEEEEEEEDDDETQPATLTGSPAAAATTSIEEGQAMDISHGTDEQRNTATTVTSSPTTNEQPSEATSSSTVNQSPVAAHDDSNEEDTADNEITDVNNADAADTTTITELEELKKTNNVDDDSGSGDDDSDDSDNESGEDKAPNDLNTDTDKTDDVTHVDNNETEVVDHDTEEDSDIDEELKTDNDKDEDDAEDRKDAENEVDDDDERNNDADTTADRDNDDDEDVEDGENDEADEIFGRTSDNEADEEDQEEGDEETTNAAQVEKTDNESGSEQGEVDDDISSSGEESE